MSSIPEATAALRAELHRKGVERHVQDAFDNLASCLVLLNSSSPSVQMTRKLCTVLRQPLLPLYNVCLRPALQLSSSVLSTVLGKLYDAHSAEDESLRAAWDATAEVILSGILDFLDQKDGVESDGTVWEVLYPIIAEFFFHDSGRGLPVFSVPLCLSAYNTLTETATNQTVVRDALRQKAVLGGERLGAVISKTKDYLLLEALLLLFARLLPSTHNTSQGRFRRVKFVKEVLGSPKLFKCNAELLDIMQKTSGTHWDDVAAQIIDVLAKSDITYPQPFSVDEIRVCGRVFPQPLVTDRLIMDRQAFLANIVAENNDICESLQVPYSHIRTITLDNSEKNGPKGKVSIMVYLTSPPLVANVEMNSPDASHLYAEFQLQNDTVGRFMEALRRRGVGKLNFLNSLTRLEKKPKNISIGLGLKFINDSSPIPPTASFEGKVQRVNQVYKTDIEDPTTFQVFSVSCDGEVVPSPTPPPRSPCNDENAVPEVLESAAAEDDTAAPKGARCIPPTSGVSESVQDFASSALPGNSGKSFGIRNLFDDRDELSEISEFEDDDKIASERAEIAVPASRSRGSKPTQHKPDRMRKEEISSARTQRTKKSSGSASKTVVRAEKSAEAIKPQSTSDSPMFGASSSTQIDVSPNLLSNADALFAKVGTEVVDGLLTASRNFGSVDTLKGTGVDGGPSETDVIIASEMERQIGFSSVTGELRKHAGHSTASSGANQEVHPRTETPKDNSLPRKLAGNRRKRESTKSSNTPTVELDDEYKPPRKKRCEDILAIEEDKVKPNEILLDSVPISNVKKFAKPAKRFSPEIGSTTVNSDELKEPKPTFQGTRRSSRNKKKQTTTTRPNAIRGKPQKGKRKSVQSACVERKKLVAVSPQDAGVEIGHRTSLTLGSHPIPLVIGESPFPKINGQVTSGELSNAENGTLDIDPPQEMLTGNNILGRVPSQPCLTPGKESREKLDVVQEDPSDAMQLVREQFCVKTEENTDNRHPILGVSTVDSEVGRVREEHWVFPKKGEDSVKSTRPILESTPRTEPVTIDLTIDDTPTPEKRELYKASVDLIHSGADIRAKFRTPDLTNSIAMEEPAFVSSPRQRRRSVTFASPIEYVLDKKVKSKTQINSLRIPSLNAARSSPSPSPAESNTLSPLRIPTWTVNTIHETAGRGTPRVTPQNSKLLRVNDQNADEAGIQDIVEVLNEIQAVIIKGISGKFKSVKKDVQHSRDELIQQVLDDLRGIVAENANYFNGLLRLEEDYYKSCKTIIRCWEELIDCNDGIAAQFENALKEHDQNISAKTFPKSLLPMQPVFPRRRATALS